MIRYTVIYSGTVEQDLAQIWLEATNRQEVASAAFEIDRHLATDASHKGEEMSEGLRKLAVSPLIISFSVEESDRIVTVWSIRRT